MKAPTERSALLAQAIYRKSFMIADNLSEGYTREEITYINEYIIKRVKHDILSPGIKVNDIIK